MVMLNRYCSFLITLFIFNSLILCIFHRLNNFVHHLYARTRNEINGTIEMTTESIQQSKHCKKFGVLDQTEIEFMRNSGLF